MSTKKKIYKNIMIHSNYHPDSFGGVEHSVRLINEFIGEFTQSRICFFGHENNISDKSGKKHVRLCGRKIIIKIAGASFLHFGNLIFFSFARKSDIIIFQEPYPGLWPAMFVLRRFLKVPTILCVHAHPVSHPYIMGMYGFLRSRIFKGAFCVTTSPNLLSQINSSSFAFSEIIPLSLPDRAPVRNQSLVLPSKYGLYVGRLASYKGIEYLIDAMVEARDVQYVIAGDGKLAQYIKEKTAFFDIKNLVFLNKSVTEDEKNELIDRSTFVLFPSISENEAFGFVQLEAMRSSKPIINTYLNSGVNYVAPPDECAITVDKKNAQAIAAASRKLFFDANLAEKLGKAGRRRYQALFTYARFKKSWSQMLQRVAKTEANVPETADR